MNIGMLFGEQGNYLGWTLIHFVWQGAVAAAVYAVVAGVMRKAKPQVRYVVACAALALLAVAPLLTYSFLASEGMTAVPVAAPSAVAPPVLPSGRETGTPRDAFAGVEHAGRVRALPPIGAREALPVSRAQAVAGEKAPISAAFQVWVDRHAQQLALAWVLGALSMALRLILSWRQSHCLRYRNTSPAAASISECVGALADRMQLRQVLAVYESALVRVPTVVGWLKPVLLVPGGLVTGMTAGELEAILAHELAHIRRHDNLINLLQCAVEALLFYHPAVWWISRRIRIERELCCDDMAVRFCGDRVLYAQALAALANSVFSAPRLTMAADGGNLAQRIRRVLGWEGAGRGYSVRWLSGVLALAMLGAVAAFLLLYQANAEAETKAPDLSVPLGERVLPFPEGEVIGQYRIRDWGKSTWKDWEKKGDFLGPITVPAGKEVLLQIRSKDKVALLRAMPPDAVQGLEIKALPEDSAALDFLKAWTHLVELHLDDSEVTDEMMGALSGIHTLKMLEISQTAVSDAGLRCLADSPLMEDADFEDTNITDAGMAVIAGWSKLTKLVLPEQITDAGFQRLAKLEHLKEVNIPLSISAAALEPFKDAPWYVDRSGRTPFVLTILDKDTSAPMAGVTAKVLVGGEKATLTADREGQLKALLPRGADVRHIRFDIDAEGYVPTRLQWRDMSAANLPESYTHELEHATSIGGYIRNEDGEGIEGATVFVLAPGGDEIVRVNLWDYECLTDAEGHWSCDRVPAKMDDVWLRLAHPDYVSDVMYGATPKPSMEQLRDGTGVMVMKRGSVVLGRVTDPEGRPVAGAAVKQGTDRWGSHFPDTATDTNGEYRFENCNQEPMILTVEHSGFAPALDTIDVAPGENRADFQLEAAHTVRGRITDSSGQPLEGVCVVADTWRGNRTLGWQGNTDAEGRFVWNAAPADEVEYHVVARGFRAIRDCRLTPSEEEQAIVMFRPLVVSGKVMDKETGLPIPAFTLVSGIDWGDGRAPSWQRGSEQQGRDGVYREEFSESHDYCIRIEAPGYLPAISRVFDEDEGDFTYDFELEKGEGLCGTLCAEDGTPLAGVDVFLCTPSQGVSLENGRIRDKQRSMFVQTDGEGAFSFPPQADLYALVVADDAGYAEVSQEEFETAKRITLAPWGQVNGVVMIGAEPGKEQPVTLSYERPYEPQAPRIWSHYQAVTDTNGRFSFERVVPGLAKVSRVIRSAPNSTSFSHGVPVEIPAGGVVDVVIGGTGRPVSGRLVLPEGHEEKISFNYGHHNIGLKVPDPPKPEDLGGTTPEETQALYLEWMKSDEGKAYQAAQRWYAMKVEEDGRFNIDDVPAGDYMLSSQVSEPPKNGQCGWGDTLGTATLGVYCAGDAGWPQRRGAGTRRNPTQDAEEVGGRTSRAGDRGQDARWHAVQALGASRQVCLAGFLGDLVRSV